MMGCRWSVLYKFCGILLILIAFNNVFQALGAYNFKSRQIASCCSCCLCCVHLAAIITTGVFRFNTWGSLAALSETGNWFDEDQAL